MKALIFSKDRAMQLDACLRSLAMHAAEPVETTVIWKASSMCHANAYDEARATHRSVAFCREYSFEKDVRDFISWPNEHVMFAVDDTIFVRRFSPNICTDMLRADRTIGFSLRLGTNTTWCYPISRSQFVPGHSQINHPNTIREWDWTQADGDFGYPLELSSSIYRTRDIIATLNGCTFRNPNELEAVLAHRAMVDASGVRQTMPLLASYSRSVAFSVPCNRVQSQFANRAGTNDDYSSDRLLQLWEDGYQIDINVLAGYVPRGAHEEVEFNFKRRT